MLPTCSAFLCHIYLPRCDIEPKQIIYPCREMCHNFINACNHLLAYKFDCDYLPPRNGNIPCFHRFSWCTAPLKVENAVHIRRNDTAHYSCSEGFTLQGYRNITCMLSGKWSRAPHCIPVTLKEETSTSTSTSTLPPPLLYTAPT